jgi:hypothetical protein
VGSGGDEHHQAQAQADDHNAAKAKGPCPVRVLLVVVGGSGTEAASPSTNCGSHNDGFGAWASSVLGRVRTAGLGTKDRDSPENQNAMIKLGNTICDGIGHFGYGKVVEVQTNEASQTRSSHRHSFGQPSRTFVLNTVTCCTKDVEPARPLARRDGVALVYLQTRQPS